ncbi:uncharacterized protein LOC134814536 [Bolinopsis microptera]|uniref:uncharacterized protein LOC134814536 n=1 Tax=Bolinopsis microptera TaxID=2820187 RepID=UPI003079ACEA
MLAGCCVEAAFDDDVTYRDDYDDAWENESMEEYNHQEHHFKHENVLPTDPIKEDSENYLERLRRASEDTEETYDDDWMNIGHSEEESETFLYQDETDLVQLAERTDEQGGQEEGTVENPAINIKYSLGKVLEPGDFIEVHGTYSADTSWFSANILDDSGNILFHLNPRPNWRKTVLNSKLGGWGSEVRCELPSLKSYEDFVMKIVLMDNFYKIYFNGKALSATFPYRREISTAKDIIFWGGNNGFKWNTLILPGTDKAIQYTGMKEFKLKVDALKEGIVNKVAGKNLQEVKTYANSTEGSLDVLQWWLMKQIQDKAGFLDFSDETLNWILTNREALEMFMTSGDIQSNKYRKALKILGDLIQLDPAIKDEPLRLRLAVATAITHSTPVASMAVGRNTIDWKARYQTYMRWSEEDVLFSPFFEGTAWHLRYVVGSWQTEEEHIWARENTPEGYDNPSKIGGATHRMMSYKLKNDDGTSVHAGSPYYYYLPVSLKSMHEIGGVCGAISKFAAGMCHAYGVAAVPVGQPGHCAYIWYRGGNWVLGNDVSGWGSSNSHWGIQYTWMRQAYYFRVMNEAQKNLAGYRLSEKLRIASKLVNPEDRFEILEDATTECPYNFAVWVDLEKAIKEPNLNKETVQNALLPVVLSQREKENKSSDIASEKIVTSECFGTSSRAMTDKHGNTAYCKQETADFEIDLEKPSTIQEIKFQWWGWSKPAEYDIYAMGEDGDYVLVKTHEDERVEGWFNHWSYLNGWDMKTTKIKMDLRKGKKDPWSGKNYFGIRTINLIGISYDILDDVSKGKPVSASVGSSDPDSLVDASNSTLWDAGENGWFEINLRQICALDDIEFFWADGEKPESVKVTYKVGSGQETEASGEDPFRTVPLEMDCGTTVKVEILGGNQVLKGVKACGVSYSTKDILKLKVNQAYEDFYYVRTHLTGSIDSMTYED